MARMRRNYWILCTSFLLAAGCGLKGPLYAPDDTKGVTVPSSAASNQRKRQTGPVPAPQSQKEDRATEELPASDPANNSAPAVTPPDPAPPTPEPPSPPPGH
jgi:predicted small lipoprotein YifL